MNPRESEDREAPVPEDPPLRLGISSCLLGATVRFDGGHKKDSFLTHDLGSHVEWVPVCPEIEVGMGVPREAIRLVRFDEDGEGASPRLLGVRSAEDWTARMKAYAAAKVKALAGMELRGYVLKSRSPSCGMERVKVYTPKGMPSKGGRGLFAEALLEAIPLLPVEDEGRLQDALIRENFVERIFTYHRWLLFEKERFTVGRLVEFHRRHKFLIMSHSETHMRALGRVVAQAKGRPARETLESYGRLLAEGMAVKTSVRKHTNVLQHIIGFFRDAIAPEDRAELREALERYRTGLVPRIVPQTLILHHLRRAELPYLIDQYYLSPHPKELVLKYHA